MGSTRLTSRRSGRRLRDVNADVRASAVRLSERWLASDPALKSAVIALADDKNWNVRRQVAASIGEMPAADRLASGDRDAHARRRGSSSDPAMPALHNKTLDRNRRSPRSRHGVLTRTADPIIVDATSAA